MPSALSQSCMQFRLETLAPSGGWLASVAIGLSVKTGIYEYTILAIIFMVSYLILRTASCESAMVLALAYDLVIPFQYQNVQRHVTELEKYWPKFLIGTAIEAGCYLLLHPDLFNLAVIIKTSILLIVWMKGKKQYPLNLAKDKQQPTEERAKSSPENPSQPSSSSSNSLREYLKYVMDELKKCTGKDVVSQEKALEHRENLKGKSGSSKRKESENSLKSRKIMLFDEWKAAQAGGGQAGGGQAGGTPSTQPQGAVPSGSVAPTPNAMTHMPVELLQPVNDQLKSLMEDEPRRLLMARLQKSMSDPDWEVAREELEAIGPKVPSAEALNKAVADSQAKAAAGGTAVPNQPQPANHTQKQPSAPTKIDYQWTKPTGADIAQLRLDLVEAKSSLPPEDVIQPLLAGPTHPEFAENLNYLRYKGINTRKWVPMVPILRTMYRVPDALIDSAMSLIDQMQAGERPAPVALLKGSYPTQDAFKTAMAKMATKCRGNTLVKPEDATLDVKVTNHGDPWYDYPQKIQAAKLEGPEEVSKLETLYDYLNDPSNVPKPKEESQKADRWGMKEREWAGIDLLHTKIEDNDWYPGTAGIPVEEIAEYRLKLDSAGRLDNGTKNAIISAVKNAPSAEQGRAIMPPIVAKVTPTSSSKEVHEVMDEWESKTVSEIEHAARLKAVMAKEAAEAAAKAASAAQSSG